MSKPKEFVLDLDGEEVGMRLDFNAMATVEELTGLNLVAEELVKPSVTQLRALIYACSAAYQEAREQPIKLTLRQIGARLNGETAGKAWLALQGLTAANVPEPTEGEGAGNPQEAPEGGQGSP